MKKWANWLEQGRLYIVNIQERRLANRWQTSTEEYQSTRLSPRCLIGNLTSWLDMILVHLRWGCPPAQVLPSFGKGVGSNMAPKPLDLLRASQGGTYLWCSLPLVHPLPWRKLLLQMRSISGQHGTVSGLVQCSDPLLLVQLWAGRLLDRHKGMV